MITNPGDGGFEGLGDFGTSVAILKSTLSFFGKKECTSLSPTSVKMKCKFKVPFNLKHWFENECDLRFRIKAIGQN